MDTHIVLFLQEVDQWRSYGGPAGGTCPTKIWRNDSASWRKLWTDVVSMMKDNGLSMELPRKSRRRLKQSTRMDEFVIMETVGARRDEMEDPESEDIDLDTHYRISIYNATLDQVIGEMNRRFSVESRSLMTAASACSPRSPSFLNCKVMEPLVEHYHLNHEMVSFQAEAAARFLQKKEVKSLASQGGFHRPAEGSTNHIDTRCFYSVM